MNADTIRFVRDRPWYPLDETHVYEIPVTRLAAICMDCWSMLADARFSGDVLPGERLRERYFSLIDRDDTTPEEWGKFMDTLWNVVDAMDLEQQADWFVELNDPVTIKGYYWLHDGIEYLDAAHAMPRDEQSTTATTSVAAWT